MRSKPARTRNPSLSVAPTGGALGAEVHGVDLARPCTPDELATIIAAWHRHIVLLFRDQRLDDDDLIAFGRRIGPLHRTEGLTYGSKPDGTPAEIEIVSNQREDGVTADGRPSDECT